jgi:quinol monooxygenase YgiN
MSGRRRHEDAWDDGRLDAQDDRRDPWADDSVGEWGSSEADPGDDADRSSASSGGGAYASGGAAGAYVRNAPPGGKAYAAPAFPSFQAGGGAANGSSGTGGYSAPGYGDDRYGAGSAPRAASNGYGAGYNGDGHRDPGYGAGRDTYQGAGYGRDGSAGNGSYGRSGYGSGGQGNDTGYGGDTGYAAANGRSAAPGYNADFSPVDNEDMDDEPQAGTPRPYGRLSIYTLHEDKTREFDRFAERAAEGVRASEPDTLVYVIHVVPKAPMQRIIYEIYRDRGAFLSHERQPHIRQFAADRAPCVLATNIIDLRLKYAKVAALGPTPEAAAQPQASWTPRAAEAAPGNDRYAATAQYSPGQYSPTTQYSPAQYPPAQPAQYSQAQPAQPAQYSSAQYSSAPAPGAGAAASFTPSKDRYGADNSQSQTVGREAFSPAAQYGNAGNGGYGAATAQYGAANSNGYSGAAGYANGGSYSGNGYQGSNGYQGTNGYSGDNSYSSANGYQSANGYSGDNGYSNGSGYSGANGYSSGSGYSGAAGNVGNGNGNDYGAASAPSENGAGAYGGSAGAQYTPRYRELTSGAQPEADADGYAGGGNRYADDGRQSARPQSTEWPPRPQDYR